MEEPYEIVFFPYVWYLIIYRVLFLTYQPLGITISTYFVGKKKEWLERPFEQREVVETLKSLKDEKAPGPNGFLMNLFKDFWGVLGKDVIKAMEEYNANATLCSSLNASFYHTHPVEERHNRITRFLTNKPSGKLL